MMDYWSYIDELSFEQIDAMIAQKVMGWRWNAVAEVWEGKPHGEGWHPSMSLVDAWAVIERMQVLGYEVSLANRKDPNGKYFWGVDFYRMIDEASLDACFTADAPDVPLAICRCALMAMKHHEADDDEDYEDFWQPPDNAELFDLLEGP